MDSPNEEITDKVGLYEKGVRWKKHDKLYQGDGSHTGTVRCLSVDAPSSSPLTRSHAQ